MGGRDPWDRGRERRGSEPLGFLQLCADRRFHRMTMTAFEARTGLEPGQYWIEASAGGAAAFGAASLTAEYAHTKGARIMGWAVHGDECGGFPGRSDFDMKTLLQAVARSRYKDFPDVEHWTLFAAAGSVEAAKLF